MKLIHTYMSFNIYRNEEPGYKLRWYTVAPMFSANTLAGVRDLIREHLKDK